MEHKSISFAFELKAIKEENPDYIGEFKAIASTYDNEDLTGDIIKRGAFIPALEKIKKLKQMPKSLIQHNYTETGAIYTDIEDTEKDLIVSGYFINTQKGRDLQVEVRTGAISAMSIGFMIGDYEYDSKKRRIIKSITDLPEISFVTFPANPKAKILTSKSSIRDFEHFLIDNGFSHNQAKTIISKGYKAILVDEESEQREAEQKALDEILVCLKEFERSLLNGR